MIVMQTIIDPVALVDQLKPDAIRERLSELDRQTRVLRLLLRAAIARARRAGQSSDHLAAAGKGGPPDVR
jgi:hypothetical protein